MSHFECRLNLRFWRSKKLYKFSKLGGGGGNLNKIQKNSHYFLRRTSLKIRVSHKKQSSFLWPTHLNLAVSECKEIIHQKSEFYLKNWPIAA